MTDKFEELVCALECAVLEKHTAPFSDRAQREYDVARAAVIAAYREAVRPTHAYCIVTDPDHGDGEVQHIWLGKAETEARVEQMNDPRAWGSDEGPYRIWTVKLGLPTVEMMDDDDLAEWKPELLKDASQ